MKNKKIFIPVFSLQIIFCLFLDWGGDRMATRLNWPVWLDSLGTALAAYLLGPWCGAVVGATYNIGVFILYGDPWYYALISILIAVITGYAVRRKYMDTLLGTLTTGAVLSFATAFCAYPINLILSGGSTGNAWGDAVIGFLGETGMPTWAGLFVAELYVEMLDKLFVLLILFVITRILKRFGFMLREEKEKKKEKKEISTAATRALILLLAAGLCLSGAGGFAPQARAEGTDTFSDINYNDYVQTVYSSTNGLPCGEANDINITRDGIIWIGTYAGLYRYNGREFRWMDGFDSVRNVNCLYVDEEGRLWIGTNDNGLSIVINEQVVKVIDQSQGLPANAVKSIIRSSDGYYYIGTTGSMQILTLNCGLKKLNTLS